MKSPLWSGKSEIQNPQRFTMEPLKNIPFSTRSAGHRQPCLVLARSPRPSSYSGRGTRPLAADDLERNIFQRFLLIIFLLVFILVFAPYAQAINVRKDDCRIAINNTMDRMVTSGNKKNPGYQEQLSNLLSTNEETYQFIPEIEELSRNMKLELQGVCREAGKLNEMSEVYQHIYQLQNCRQLPKSVIEETGTRIEIFNYCQQQMGKHLNAFLDELEPYLTRQALRTSFELLVQRFRVLNSKLLAVLTEYNRAVNNFYAFNFRLGDTIVKDPD